MGNFFSSKVKTKSTKAPFESSPWAAQQPYLTSGFSGAKTALDDALASNQGITDFTADMTPDQYADLQRMRNASDAANGVSSTAINTGLGLLSGFGQAQGNNTALWDQATSDPTDKIISNAGKFADNPYLQGQIDAAISDVNRGLQLEKGNINTAATGTGNVNSTRAGTLDAYATKDAADRAAQIATGMRSDAYKTGLGQAGSDYWSGLGTAIGVNDSISNLANTGMGLAMDGYGIGMQGASDALAASTMVQQQSQAEIEGKIAQSQRPMDLYQQYLQMIGGNYGSQGFQTQVSQKQTASPFQQVVGGAMALGGLGARPFGGA